MKIFKKVALLLFVSLVIANVKPVMAATNNVNANVISVKSNLKTIKVKVKISNNSKNAVEFGDYFDLYKKKAGKWKKMKWKNARYFDDEEHVVLPGGSFVKKYTIPKKDLEKTIKKGKYQLRFKLSGKNKKLLFKL